MKPESKNLGGATACEALSTQISSNSVQLGSGTATNISSPILAQDSRPTSNRVSVNGSARSSKKNPCPVCDRSHDPDCSIRESGNMVFCHSRQTGTVGEIISGYKFLKTSDKGAGWGVWVWDGDKPKKSTRPEVEPRSYELYPDRDGNNLIRVVRQKGAKVPFYQQYWIGGVWLSASKVDEAVKAQMRSKVPLFRYAEVREAIGRGERIFFVEGEKCANALWSIGVPATTSIAGSKSLESWGDYSNDLEGAEVIVTPDRDRVGMEYAEKVANYFSYEVRGWLYAFPESPLWDRLTKDGGADIADWIAEGATREDILNAIEDEPRQFAEAAPTVDPGVIEPEVERVRLDREYRLVQAKLGDRLRYNSLINEIELDGNPINMETLKLNLVIDHGLQIKSSREDCTEIVTKLSKANQYNPVQDYLELVHQKHGDSTEILRGIHTRYFGVEENIYFVFLVRTLIAAVARVYEPGCKHDEVLILQGWQGAGKSSFFKRLASPAWFDDSMGDCSDKDQILKLHRTWFMEWGELESVFRKKDVSRVKEFLACDKDVVRPPYGRVNIELKRRSVIVGSTNQDEFLNDPTGNRRFWIIPIEKHFLVPLNLLDEERDRIWAAAVALYKDNLKKRQRNKFEQEAWRLSPLEWKAAANVAENYQAQDAWLPKIAAYVEGKESVLVPAVLSDAIGMDLDRQDKAAQMRVSATLTQLGWESKRVWIDGRRVRGWAAPSGQPGQPGQLEEKGCPVAETIDISSLLTPSGQPGQPITVNEAKNTPHLQLTNDDIVGEGVISYSSKTVVQVVHPDTVEASKPSEDKGSSQWTTSDNLEDIDLDSDDWIDMENPKDTQVESIAALINADPLNAEFISETWGAIADFSREALIKVWGKLTSEAQTTLKAILKARNAGQN